MLENKNGPIKSESHIPKIEEELAMLSLLLIGVGFAIMEFEYISKQIAMGDEIDTVVVTLLSAISFFVISLGWMVYTDYKAYFDYSEEGLGVKYLLQKRKVIPWSEFQQICICYTSYSTRGERTAHSVLCFVKKGEKKNIYGRWKASNPYHSRSVISMEYTDELYKEVQKHCPYEIPDLRGKGNYRL